VFDFRDRVALHALAEEHELYSSEKKDFVNMLLSMCGFGYRRWTTSNVEGYPTFRQTLQLPSSG
jgi:hypothetical protein